MSVLVVGLEARPSMAAPAAPASGASAPAAGSRPDLVSARIVAAAGGSRVEVLSMDTETSTTWANPDGSLTTEYSSVPVRMRADDGSWTPVATKVSAPAADGSLSVADNPLAPTFAADAASAHAVTVDTDRGRLSMGLRGAEHADVVGKGSTVSYADVLPGTDLTYEVQPGAVKESIVVSDASRSSWTFQVNTEGLTPAQDDAGSLIFTDRSKRAVLTIPAALAWDSAGVRSVREPSTTSANLSYAPKAGGGWLVTVSVDPAWLADPARVFPVTVDPTVAYTPDAGTAFKSDGTSCAISACGLKVGNTNEVSAGRFWRTAWHVPYEKLAGKHVTAASVAVTVTAGTTNAYGSGTGGPVVLSTASSLAYAGKGTQLATAAVGSSGTFSSSTLTSTLNSWTTGKSSGHYFMFSGWEAAGTYTYKQLSASVSITYNSYPGEPVGRSVKPCSAQCTGTSVLTNSLTPQLTGNTSDPDGNKLRYDFEVWAGWAASPTTKVTYGSVSNVSSGVTAAWAVPTKLANGSQYEYRVRAFDGTDYGAWSNGWVLFSIDTAAPAAPTITSDTWTAGDWDKATGGTISWSDTSTDVASYSWQLDGGSWSMPSTATATTLAGLKDGSHKFVVKATDKAGNSTSSEFDFGVGLGGLSSPKDQDRTQSTVTLSVQPPGGYPYTTYQWRQGDTATWVNVPLGDVTVTGDPSSHPGSWPVAVTDSFVWNLRTTVTTAGGSDGVVQVRACLSQNADGSNPLCPAAPTHVQLAAHAFGASYATSSVGPGSVSLLTGDFQASATDVNVAAYNGSLSLDRTSTTLAPAAANTNATGVFGPGWTASLTGPDSGAAAATAQVAADKSYITLTDSDGGQSVYEATSALTADPVTYTGDGDAADGSTMTLGSAGAVLTHVDVDGTKTTWSKVAGLWVPASVVQTGAAAQNTTSYLYNTSGAAVGLPKRVIAAAPAGVDCGTEAKADSTAGCRSLTFDYTTVTVGGAAVQRLADVNLVVGGRQPVQVAAYDYDTTGRLAHAWDPRIPTPLKTTYTYDGAGRLSTVTPPGLSSWTLHFDGDGRLSTVTRPDPSGQTATWTVVYGLPIQGGGAPVDLSAATTATWGQGSDLPVVGAAVFSPDHVPAGTDLASVTAADWPYADLTYLDVNGRAVDTASYGAGAWQIATTRYNTGGNEVWSLTAGNRAQALQPTADTDPAVAAKTDSADRANLLATQSTYNADGTELIDVLGPTHPVTLTDGSVIDARAHTVTAYDEGAPADGGPYRRATTTTTSALDLDGADHEAQASHQGYDPIQTGDTSGWTLRAPTTSTNAAGLVTTTRYNAAGQVIETRLPGGAAGGTAQSTVTTYFDASGTGDCGTAAFAGLTCSTGPAAQPASGKPLATTTFTYDMYDNVVTKTETFGGTTRTTTTTYDSAERVTGNSVTVTPEAAGGTPLPAVSYGYDSATGLPTTTSTTTGSDTTTLATGYDQLGRPTSYTDATGNVSHTSYDIDGRPVILDDGKGTTTYTYDSATEHRGLLTGLDVGVPGTPSSFTGSYDAAGNLATETYPNGWTATTSYDNTGDAVGLDYATGDGTDLMSFSQASNAQGQTVTQSSPQSSQVFGYDGAGRLTTVADTVTDQNTAQVACTTRTYGFDADSNRTTLKSYPAADDGTCTTNTSPATATSSYDQADRLTNTGYAYDDLGRTTTVPAADAQGTGSHAGISGDLSVAYDANDMVQAETQGGVTRNYTLDPLQNRIATMTEGAATTTNHYGDAGDSPAWTEAASGWTRNLGGLGGGLEATATSAGTVTLQLANMRGDIVATATDDSSATAVTAYFEASEYGMARDATDTPDDYSWLGGQQRESDTLGGLVLMGVRLYAPSNGRFLSIDPVPGGNSTAYSYVPDPIDQTDITGQCVEDLCIGEGAAAWAAGAAAVGAFGWLWATTHGNHHYRVTLPSIHINIFHTSEHKKNARKSTKNKHEDANTRRKRDQQGEKKEKAGRYKPNKNKRRG